MKKILIVGASGFLGTKLYDMFLAANEVIGTYFGRQRRGLVSLDVTDAGAVSNLIKSCHPDIVVHTVAMSDVRKNENS